MRCILQLRVSNQPVYFQRPLERELGRYGEADEDKSSEYFLRRAEGVRVLIAVFYSRSHAIRLADMGHLIDYLFHDWRIREFQEQ